MKPTKLFLLPVISFFNVSSLTAQTMTWDNEFSFPGEDLGFFTKIIQSDSKNLLLAAYMEFGWFEYSPGLMKIDTNGNQIWAKAYDFIDSYQMITKTLVEIPDDSIYYSFCFDPSWPVPIKTNRREDLVNECRLLKFNSVGDTLTSYYYTDIGWVNDLIYDEGFLIVAGGTNYEDEPWNFYSKPTIIVVDTSGNLIFRKEFFTDTNGRINSVIKKPDGDYYVVGSTELHYDPGYYQPDRMFLMELDHDFNPVWTFVSDIQFSEGNKIIRCNDDSYAIIGDGYNISSNNQDILLWKINSDTLIDPPWFYDISHSDNASSIKQTMDNGFIFCGSVIPQNSSFTSFFYMKINAEGIEEWHWNNNPFYHEAYDVLPGNSGYYVAGHGSGAKLVKTDLTGYGLETSLPDHSGIASHDILKVYPNPTEHHITIEFNLLTNCMNGSVEILDIYARTIVEVHLTGEKKKMDIPVDNYCQGLYLVRLVCNHHTIACAKFTILGGSLK